FRQIAHQAGFPQLADNAADPTRFHGRVIGARQGLQAKIASFAHFLPSIPTTTLAFWRWALARAWEELRSEFLQPIKVWVSVGTMVLSFLVQYSLGIRTGYTAVLSIVAGLIAYVVVNLGALGWKTVSVPTKLLSRQLVIRRAG